MQPKIYNVLFVCAGNSSKSILAESILNGLGGGHFRAYSAGIYPVGHLHSMTIEMLTSENFDVSGLRSKGLEEFLRLDAPSMDFVITLGEDSIWRACPAWPGEPVTVHWHLPDPAAVEGPWDARKAAFSSIFRGLRERLGQFVAIPFHTFSRGELAERLRRLGTARRSAEA